MEKNKSKINDDTSQDQWSMYYVNVPMNLMTAKLNLLLFMQPFKYPRLI